MFLKGFIPGFLMIAFASCALAQELKADVDSAYVAQKIQVIKSVLKNGDFDEERFRLIYREYISEQKKNIKCSFLTLNNLAKIASATEPDSEFFDCLNSLLVHREADILIKKKYFSRIAYEMGELVALQFLHVEGIVNFMAQSDACDPISGSFSPLRKPRLPSGSCFTTLSNLSYDPARPKGPKGGKKFTVLKYMAPCLDGKYIDAVTPRWLSAFDPGAYGKLQPIGRGKC